MISQKAFFLVFVLLILCSAVAHSQYSITGDIEQTINFTGYDGGGFEAGATTSSDGTLDSDMWGVDLDNDGTMDLDFGDTDTGVPYAGGTNTSRYNISPYGPGSIRAATFSVERLSVRHAQNGTVSGNGHEGDIAIILRMQNNSGGDISSLAIAHSLQSYTTGGAADIEFYYSADNSSYTELAAMSNTFNAGTNWGDDATDLGGSISTTISDGSFYYFKWVFLEMAAGSGAIGIVDIDITASIAAGDGEGTITAGTTNFGDLSATSASDPGEDVFDLTITDDASTGDDSFPIQFSGVVFNAASSDGIDDWSDVIAGARLEDGGGNFINATSIGTSSITFSSIPLTSSDLGYVADGGSDTYTLSVWLNTSINEDIDGDLFHVDITGADFTFSGATSTITTTETAESNTSYNTITVTGTNWGFDNQPTTVGVDEDFSLTIASLDAYGNVDIDDNVSTFILSRGSTGSGSLTEGGATLTAKTVTNGRYTYSDLQHDTAEEFNIDVDDSGGSFLTSTTSSNITAAVSYQSAASGNWTTAANWEFWNGSAWQTASNSPTSTTGTIYIRNGTVMSVDADITVDQVVIESGGEIINDQNGDVITIQDGPGEDFTIESGGVWSFTATNANTAPVTNGTVQVQSGGMIYVTNANALDDFGEDTQIEWQTDAVLYVTGNPPFDTNFFPNVAAGIYPILELDGSTADPGRWTLNGILKVSSGTFTIDAGTEVTIRDGFLGDGNIILDAAAAFTFTGTTMFLGGAGSLDLDTRTLSLAGTTIEMISDKEVFNGTLSLDGSSILDGSTFSLNDGTNDNLSVNMADGATIYCNSTGGLASTLAIGGTYTLDGGMDYYFEGTAQQTLGFGTVGVTAANRVTVNNSNGVILDSDLTVNERITLTSGIFSTSSSSEVISIASTAVIVGASSTNYFDGPIEIQGFTGSKTFHVGDGSDYRSVILDPVNASNFTIEHFSSTPADNTNVTDPIKSIASDRYWAITRGSGSGDVEVTLNFDDSADGISGSTELRVVHYTTSWQEAGTGYDAHSSSSVTSTTSDFSNFAIGSTDYPLPVELASFSGLLQEENVLLEWQTDSELNNDRFDVEFSSNGTDFSRVGEVIGAGTVSRTQYYEFIHPRSPVGASFYRLKQIDFDGAFEYSPTIRINMDEFSNALQLLQNPISDKKVRFRYTSSTQPDIRIFNASGKKIYQSEIKSESGIFVVNVGSLPHGLYLLFVNDSMQKIIID